MDVGILTERCADVEVEWTISSFLGYNKIDERYNSRCFYLSGFNVSLTRGEISKNSVGYVGFIRECVWMLPRKSVFYVIHEGLWWKSV